MTTLPPIPPDATVRVEVPANSQPPAKARNWTLILLVVALVMSALTNVGVVILVSSTNRIVRTTDAEDGAITEHRIRNELSHEALCAEAEAIVRSFGRDPATLTDTNGKPVKCPAPLTDDEIRSLSAHPSDGD